MSVFVGTVSVLGVFVWWRARQRIEAADTMMREMMGHGIKAYSLDPIWYLILTLLGVSIVSGVYLTTRLSGGGAVDRGGESSGLDEHPSGGTMEDPSEESGLDPLVILPADEQRVMEPVLLTPGLTQVELRDRSDFSKSKVSQVVTTLEKRGLLYREPQGRTYRIYPGELIKQISPESP